MVCATWVGSNIFLFHFSNCISHVCCFVKAFKPFFSIANEMLVFRTFTAFYGQQTVSKKISKKAVEKFLHSAIWRVSSTNKTLHKMLSVCAPAFWCPMSVFRKFLCVHCRNLMPDTRTFCLWPCEHHSKISQHLE